jgi:hypothetical protein
MKAILKAITEQERKYRAGEQVAYELTTERTTKAGTTIRYTAKRDDGQRGLSYDIYSARISIRNGVQEKYEGHTNQFGFYGTQAEFIKACW